MHTPINEYVGGVKLPASLPSTESDLNCIYLSAYSANRLAGRCVARQRGAAATPSPHLFVSGRRAPRNDRAHIASDRSLTALRSPQTLMAA